MPAFLVSLLAIHFSGLHRIVVRPSPESTAEEQYMCCTYGRAGRSRPWLLTVDVVLDYWKLDRSGAEAGIAKGAELDWEATIEELLRG
jgi:hypothetical protein